MPRLLRRSIYIKGKLGSGKGTPKEFAARAADSDVLASRKVLGLMNKNFSRDILATRAIGFAVAFLGILFLTTAAAHPANAQDQDDPPGRVARLGYIQGSVSFQPAGESEWVEAVANRPLTTGDKIWADRDSRAEVQLGSAMINLAPNTGFSFLNLDDRTVQIELTSGTLNIRVWNLERDNVFEVDTANQAFTAFQPGRYRIDASEDGNSTVVTIRDGEGESTGNGQSYSLHAGQRTTFTGTNALNAEVEQIGGSDQFDTWADSRERRYDDSPSARYCSRRVVGFEDLDDNGDWQSTPQYGYAWFPRVESGWAPYHTGHWAWIDPWGWTWVDQARWGYAPFHYGRWASMGGRWGWIPGPLQERPVYAPALVAFVGGTFAVGSTVAWFPLGPREVYVPSYRVSPAYVNRVNVTNTTVNVTQVTNVYNTTIVKNNTTINNVTYVNRNVQGGVTAMPQRAFASAQPVGRTAVAVNQQELARSTVVSRAAVPPVREAVLGPNAGTANRVAAPPQAVANRIVIAKAAPPPPAASFAARQQTLAQHPGQPINRVQMQQMRPSTVPARMVRQAPPAKPAIATPAVGRPGNQPAANQPGANQPGSNQPGNRPGNPGAIGRPGGNPTTNQPSAQPAPSNQPGSNTRPFVPPGRSDRPPSAQPNAQPQPNQPQPNRPQLNQPSPNRPEPNQPTPNNRPEANPSAPSAAPSRNDRPPSAQPNSRPDINQPRPNNGVQPNAPNNPPSRNDRPQPTQPDNRPDTNQPRPNQPRTNQPTPNDRTAPQPDNRPQPNRSEPPARNNFPSTAPPNTRPTNQPNADQPRPVQPRQDQPRNDQPRNDRPQARSATAADATRSRCASAAAATASAAQANARRKEAAG